MPLTNHPLGVSFMDDVLPAISFHSFYDSFRYFVLCAGLKIVHLCRVLYFYMRFCMKRSTSSHHNIVACIMTGYSVPDRIWLCDILHAFCCDRYSHVNLIIELLKT